MRPGRPEAIVLACNHSRARILAKHPGTVNVGNVEAEIGGGVLGFSERGLQLSSKKSKMRTVAVSL